ncbi:MAG: DUF924 domain-containing protein [Candidatus Lambdaproteobacteria bacterium]|nr:DUF924 domain-containing protein [Candidatus Lambdaproteobacteria bacterium]
MNATRTQHPPVTEARGVLAFWFGLKSPGKKDDRRVQSALGLLHRQAARGQLEGWREEARERLALILLLDQVPRHLYREQPRSYATDLQAQALTRRFFERGDWRPFEPIERFYAALPYLHAEAPALQEQVNPVIHACAEAIPELAFMGPIADLYRETIARFGRFPHRNAMLGRSSTPLELRFLEEEWAPRRRRGRRAPGAGPASAPAPGPALGGHARTGASRSEPGGASPPGAARPA